MLFRSFVTSCRVLMSFIQHPLKSFKLLGRLPTVLRGFDFSQKWPASQTDRPPQPSSGSELAPDQPNPLRSYFDAYTEGPGIVKWVHYFDVYHRHFAKFVGREVNILEIGIFSGGSLPMWRSYFGPKCHIYGIDIEDVCKAHQNEYTDVFIGDQEDRGFWRTFKETSEMSSLSALDMERRKKGIYR